MTLQERLLEVINHEAGYTRFEVYKETDYTIFFSVICEPSRQFKIFKSDVELIEVVDIHEKISMINEKIKPVKDRCLPLYTAGDPFW